MAHPDVIVLSVRIENADARLRKNSFEASVRVPLVPGIEKNFNQYVERWLALTRTALVEGVSDMDAILDSADAPKKKRKPWLPPPDGDPSFRGGSDE